MTAADNLYTPLYVDGIETLYDDHPDQEASVKFNDADLLGLAIRLMVSPRNLRASVVELCGRADADTSTVPLDDVVDAVQVRLTGGSQAAVIITANPVPSFPSFSLFPAFPAFPSFPILARHSRESGNPLGINVMLDFGTREIQPAAMMRR